MKQRTPYVPFLLACAAFVIGLALRPEAYARCLVPDRTEAGRSQELRRAIENLGLIRTTSNAMEFDVASRAFVRRSRGTTPRVEISLSENSPHLTIRRNDSAFEIKLVPAAGSSRPGSLWNGTVVYPSDDGRSASVYRALDGGIKEDIVVLAPEDAASAPLSWRLQLPSLLESRMEVDGSIGIYGPDPLLAGTIEVGDEESARRLASARARAPRNHFQFRIPAPVIRDSRGDSHTAARFELSGDRLSLRLLPEVSKLPHPIAIDPTVTVTTTADFRSRGTAEEMVTTTSDQITRDRLTSGRYGNWTSTSSFLNPRQGHASCAYNGYLYIAGGNFSANEVQYAPINADGTVGSWTQATVLPEEHQAPAMAAYNGFLYVTGGSNAASGTLDLVLVAPIQSNGSIGAWTTTTPLTTPRSSHTSFAYNGFLYVTGGYTPATGATNEVRFSPIRADGTIGAWASAGTFTTARESHGSAVHDGYLYILAGSGSALNDVQVARFNSDGTVGTFASTTPLPTGRYAFGTATWNGYLYVMGGYNSTNLSDTYFAPIRADGSVGSWTSSTALFTARRGLSAVAYDGRLYITGGFDTGLLNEVRYATIDPLGKVGSFSSTTSLPAGRSGHATFVHGGHVYVLGGYDGTNYLSDVHSAPINTDGTLGAWTATTSLPSGRRRLAVAFSNRYLYILGGEDATGPLSDVYFAVPSTTGTMSGWSAATSFTGARHSHGAFACHGRLYVLGGMDAANALSDVQYATLNTTNGTVNGTWTTSANPLPAARRGAAVTVYNNRIYVLGGGPAGSYTTSVYVASINPTDGSVGTWTTTTSFTASRAYASAVAYNGYLHVGGGENGFGVFGDLQIAPINLDGTVGTWTASSTFPAPRSQYGLAVQNGFLYAVGGYDGTYLSSVQVAAIDVHGSLVWNGTGALDTGRQSHVAVAYNGYLYVVGGSTTASLATTDVRYAAINADGSLGTWTATTAFSTARYNHAAVATNGRLYVIAGYNAGELSDVQYATINADGSIGTWAATTSLPAGRNALSAVVYNGYLYVAGGFSTPTVNNDVLYAPINSNGTLGAWTTATNTFPTGRTFHSTAAYNGFLYVVGGGLSPGGGIPTGTVYYAAFNSDGSLGSFSTGQSFPAHRFSQSAHAFNGHLYVIGGVTNGFRNDVMAAPLHSDGSVGSWTFLNPLPATRLSHASAEYRGTLYVTGGMVSSVPYSTDIRMTRFSPVNRGTYARVVDLGSDVTVNSVTVNGASSKRGTVRLQYRLATSAGLSFGSESSTNPVTLGTAVSVAQTARYVFVRVTLDDTLAAAVNADATNARDVTDIVIDYSGGIGNNAPADPASLLQFRLDGITGISTGGSTNQTGVRLQGTVTDPDANSVKLQVEVKPTGISFDGTINAESIFAASGSTVQAEVLGLADNTYHWRARAVDSVGAASGWVSYGANPEANTDFSVSTGGNVNPSAPASLGQFRSDAATAIGVGGTTTESTVVFKGTVTDFDAGQTVKLQIEVRPVGTSFSNFFTSESALMASGSTAQIIVAGLSDDSYHWQARAVDNLGGFSSWTSFAGNAESEADFRIDTSIVVPPPGPGISGSRGRNSLCSSGSSFPGTVVLPLLIVALLAATRLLAGGRR